MFIRRISDSFDKSTRIIVIQTLFVSLMNYCIAMWGFTNVNLLHRVQKLENFAVKIASGEGSKDDHVTPIIKGLQWVIIKGNLFEK